MKQVFDLPVIIDPMLIGPAFRLPKNVPELLSRARSEFINAHDPVLRSHTFTPYGGQYMTLLSTFFNTIAIHLYNTTFIWSSYNKGQWDKFVRSHIGFEGGACMFSLQSDGDLSETSGTSQFEGLGVGVPLGMYPYSLFPVHVDKGEALKSAVNSLGYTSDLIGT